MALSWLVRMEPFWLVGEEADGDIAVQLWLLDWESLSPILVEIELQELLYKG